MQQLVHAQDTVKACCVAQSDLLAKTAAFVVVMVAAADHHTGQHNRAQRKGPSRQAAPVPLQPYDQGT